MVSERTDMRQQLTPPRPQASKNGMLSRRFEEKARAALALLLGPETEYGLRIRAMRHLIRQGAEALPLLLSTLSHYPEITTPRWPLHPPQYEQCGRLLLYLSRTASLSLEELLHHPAVAQPAGPVLWTSVMEAISFQCHEDHEELLRQGLKSSWMSVRYAAAIALAERASKTVLQEATLDMLRECQSEDEAFPVYLAASYTLLSSGKSAEVEALLPLLDQSASAEVRKAATFILASELPIHFSFSQRERITRSLLRMMCDADTEIALHAGHALCKIASPSALPSLYSMLKIPDVQMVVLTTLEEMTQRDIMRSTMQRQGLPGCLAPLLRAEEPEVRRQACYTLASCGGEYVMAVLGTAVINSKHPCHVESIEALRLLHGVLQVSTRMHVIRWLQKVLEASQTREEAKIAALDSLAYLLWLARRKKQGWQHMSKEILNDGAIVGLLNNKSAWVRQRALELLSMLPPSLLGDVHIPLLRVLCTDSDSGVRACAAHVCGRIAARCAIPYLIHTLLDSDEHVAETALSSLGRLATLDDALVRYVVQELAGLLEDQQELQGHNLLRLARKLLIKWQKASKRQAGKNLHTSP